MIVAAAAMAGVIAVSVVVLIVLLERAPIGYQDEDGFHLGRPPRPPVQALPAPTSSRSGKSRSAAGKNHASVRGAGQDRP
jgi:hypothetical protein